MFKKTLETVKYTVKLSLFGLLSCPGNLSDRTIFNALALVILLRGIAPHILQFVKATIFG
jgi:hypothetical protein